MASKPLFEDAAAAVLDLVEIAVLQGMKYVEESQRHQFVLDLRNLLAPIAAEQSNTARRVFGVIASGSFQGLSGLPPYAHCQGGDVRMPQ